MSQAESFDQSSEKIEFSIWAHRLRRIARDMGLEEIESPFSDDDVLRDIQLAYWAVCKLHQRRWKMDLGEFEAAKDLSTGEE